MELEGFESDLAAMVRARSVADGNYTSASYVEQMADWLADVEEVNDLQTSPFVGTGRRGKRLQIDGLTHDLADNSLVILASEFRPDDVAGTLTATEAKKIFSSAVAFVEEASAGLLRESLEESTIAFDWAETIRMGLGSFSSIRFYLVTNARMSERIRNLPSQEVAGQTATFQIWDVQRFFLALLSRTGREQLSIDLTEWLPDGLAVLAGASSQSGAMTFLAVIPGQMLSDLYERHGSRLLEANVRSFLSARGRVNAGIRRTLVQEPDMFLAYNNGLTTTATGIELSADGSRLLRLEDWQIVNGGQTTASLAAFARGDKAASLANVHVQVKLVVTDEEHSLDLVQSIARFANSQNRVSDADFFSNSPFHRRLEELSRRILAPAKPGMQFGTRWFYERARGQYLNEKGRLSAAELKRWELQNPRSQVISKTDLAKYAFAWGGKPHMVSQGAQANFVKFAEVAVAVWDKNNDDVNEAYFRNSVAKAIIFNQVRASVMRAEWYEGGYLANIVAYGLSAVAHRVSVDVAGQSVDLAAVWAGQGISSVFLDEALLQCRQALAVLTTNHRPVANVTQWAKQEACWETMKTESLQLSPGFVDELQSATTVRAESSSARAQQKQDSGIDDQAFVLGLPKSVWRTILALPNSSGVLSPDDRSIVGLMEGERPFVPSERQARRVRTVVERAIARGDLPTITSR